MKRILLTLIILISAAALLTAQDVSADYVEGWVDLKLSGGDLYELLIGDALAYGDTVITSTDGYAELRMANDSIIKVNEDTVFTVGEVQEGNDRRTVFSNTVGSVAYKFNKFTGNEPGIRSGTAVMGVRGTEFTVFAGDNGASLVAVTTGKVVVSSGGEEVALTENQAVDVKPGEKPGEVFEWKGKELDFSSWNEGQVADFLADPIGGLENVRRRLEEFEAEIEVLFPLFEEGMKQIEIEKQNLQKVKDEKGQEAFEKYREEILGPVMDETQILFMNTRFNALSALSLRRFVMGNMYTSMKSRYYANPETPEFLEFLDEFNAIINEYEERVVPQLVEADI